MPKGKPRNGNRLRRGEKAAIVAASALGSSKGEVAKAFGVSYNTVKAILKDPNYVAVNNQEFTEAAKILATMSLGTSIRAEKHITDEKLSQSSAVQLKVVGKIGVEMAHLLTDRPTEIHKHDDVTMLAATTLQQLKNALSNVVDVEEIPLNDPLPTNNTTVNTPETGNTPDTVAKSS